MANSQFAMAVHVLAMLANNCDERMKSGYIAKSVNTNAVVIRRLLCDLHNAGLVASQSGYSGGTCLTKQPGDIRLLEVYEAVSHDEVFGLHPKTPNQDCDIGLHITPILGELQRAIDAAVKEKFADYTLQNIIDNIKENSEKTGD
ncbi:MAG: Rrf2 family transcriptional regulator [Acidobacteria bacterium]|nr:Rrf2 family transcriptional regulator [Acidobacteriota bacterium]